MKVIFLQDVVKMGRRYDVKEINDGYAMNFLIPRKLAVLATPKAIAEIEKRKQNIAIEREVRTDLLMKNLAEIKEKTVIIKSKSNNKGSLFKAIHKTDIVAEMKKEHHAEIDEAFIVLEKPIKEIGEFDIPIEIQGNKSSFKLIVEKL